MPHTNKDLWNEYLMETWQGKQGINRLVVGPLTSGADKRLLQILLKTLLLPLSYNEPIHDIGQSYGSLKVLTIGGGGLWMNK